MWVAAIIVVVVVVVMGEYVFIKIGGYRNKSVNTKFLEQKQFLVNTDKELDAHRGQTLDKTQTQ